MEKVHCKIIPQDQGWVFVVDNTLSEAYPSYDLAVTAARRQIAIERGNQVKRVDIHRLKASGDFEPDPEKSGEPIYTQ